MYLHYNAENAGHFVQGYIALHRATYSMHPAYTTDALRVGKAINSQREKREHRERERQRERAKKEAKLEIQI